MGEEAIARAERELLARGDAGDGVEAVAELDADVAVGDRGLAGDPVQLDRDRAIGADPDQVAFDVADAHDRNGAAERRCQGLGNGR